MGERIRKVFRCFQEPSEKYLFAFGSYFLVVQKRPSFCWDKLLAAGTKICIQGHTLPQSMSQQDFRSAPVLQHLAWWSVHPDVVVFNLARSLTLFITEFYKSAKSFVASEQKSNPRSVVLQPRSPVSKRFSTCQYHQQPKDDTAAQASRN